MSHTDSTDDTDLSPLGSVAKHEMLENLRTRYLFLNEHEICRRPTDQREVIFRIARMSPMGSLAGVSCLKV